MGIDNPAHQRPLGGGGSENLVVLGGLLDVDGSVRDFYYNNRGWLTGDVWGSRPLRWPQPLQSKPGQTF